MKKTFLIIALLAAVPSMSAAADSMFDEADEEDRPLKTSVFLYPFVEKYKWNEFFAGTQIEENEGELYGAGAMVTMDSGRALGRLRGEWFQGKLDARGMTQAGLPWETEVNHYGFRLELDGAWRVRTGRVTIAPLMGVGYRWWRRDFEDSPTVVGRGLDKWHTVYLKFGALAEANAGGGIVPYAEAGIRLGVFNNEEFEVSGTRVSVDPGGRLTPYAELGLTAAFLKMAAYYERVEFAQSEPKATPVLPPGFGFVQPEVTGNIFGARVGIAF